MMGHLQATLTRNLPELDVGCEREPDVEPSCRDLWAARVAGTLMEALETVGAVVWSCIFVLPDFEPPALGC